ncbi:fungal-specific transcription factor domain-containing protein [Melanogaster broomeanus]|nr:fungal-specific transcription factor domain-containing protein [Melanogaster broomeanus]
MPPEPTKGKLKRRSIRKEAEEYKFDGGHSREIEQKRNNGQISCAECRRLKIKCDKQIPCQSCQRRGCAALCPNGVLATGQGTRFVLAATEHLHRRIAKMSERIRLLEDALGELQSQRSTEPHPLLRDDLLGVNQKDDEPSIPSDESGAPSHPLEVLDAFGTLSITDHGISRFFGPTGGSECLLMSDNIALQESIDSPPDQARDSKSPSLPQDVRMFSQAFPFTPMGPVAAVRELIEGQLPNWERANYLTQTYSEQAGWLFRGVPKEQIEDELLPVYYSNAPLKATDDEHNSAHSLAVLFLVFAVGALVDLRQEPGNAEAEHYHQIARAAICLQPVLEKPTLVTIEALHLLSIYNAMSGNELTGRETSMETTWSLIVLAAHLSQSDTAELDRDSVRWSLPDEVVQRRRILFWDLFVADAWHSLDTGRPPSLSLAYIDCRFPGIGSAGETGTSGSFESWGFRFACECVAEVAARTLTAEAPSYATIMELDRKVREFAIPEPAAQMATSASGPIPLSISGEDMPPSESMARFVMSHSREVSNFFAQAIIENPVNPLKSQYAPSFLAAYRASSTILRTIEAQYAIHPNLCARFWSTWTFAFSAAVVFGTIVTRGPRSPLASNAIKDLDDACLLFTKSATLSRRAAKALPILTKLSEKAHTALAAVQNDKATGQVGQQWAVKEEDDEDDELAIFAGRTRFVSTKRLPESAQASEGTGGVVYPGSQTTIPERPIPAAHSYQLEPPTTSVDRWAHTERDELRYQPRPAEYTNASVQPQPQIMSQWRPPQRPDYPYGTQQPTPPPSLDLASAPQHLSYGNHSSARSSPYDWSSGVRPANFSGAGSHSQSYPQQHHYEQSQPSTSASVHHSHHHHHHHHPQQQPAQAVPSEPTELGLVSQESRLDERWTSFMRDSGHLAGFDYRGR